ncbi:hypothetical protein IQ264_19805 [Phormidium sp. LEGE 05292]|uniref:hypothetical protein n=1 Tax=[Phormidium] sp. LEGE 05292 TaxID=767427 RepID=UPI00187F25BE|nr:hypothetical protein [Phormidium sp. LEGE 05292]MBE9227676.1 hypothetical protein [Phormidium sp. LEGE 05292]
MGVTNSFAILAPVPEIHLISGQETIAQLSNEPNNEIVKLAFGSMAFEVFRQIDELRQLQSVEVFIYASDSTADQPLHTQASWHGLYIGHVPSRNGRYPGNKKFRPPSTLTDKPTWAVFWEVQELKFLDKPIEIASLKGLNKKSPFSSRFIPEGPVLIEYP